MKPLTMLVERLHQVMNEQKKQVRVVKGSLVSTEPDSWKYVRSYDNATELAISGSFKSLYDKGWTHKIVNGSANLAGVVSDNPHFIDDQSINNTEIRAIVMPGEGNVPTLTYLFESNPGENEGHTNYADDTKSIVPIESRITALQDYGLILEAVDGIWLPEDIANARVVTEIYGDMIPETILSEKGIENTLKIQYHGDLITQGHKFAEKLNHYAFNEGNAKIPAGVFLTPLNGKEDNYLQSHKFDIIALPSAEKELTFLGIVPPTSLMNQYKQDKVEKTQEQLTHV